jgi:ADP-heptose:LPS heptosyltransferase
MTSLTLPPRPKILVVRRDNIGDLVCTTPAIAALRKHYPDAEIAALVNSYNAEVLRGNPNLDQVFVYQKLKHAGGLCSRLKALIERLKLINRLRRWNPDVTILAKASYERHGLNFARLIGAKNVIGYVQNDLNEAKGLPDIGIATPEFAALHEVEAVNGLLKPLGIEDALGPLQAFPDADLVQRTGTKFKQPRPLRLALHLSAREPERRWGQANYLAFIRQILSDEPGLEMALFWSPGSVNDPAHPGDDELAAHILKTLADPRLIPMPTRNLSELIAGLSCCHVFVGTDGGAMHLAVATHCYVVALFEKRPEKIGHWYPWATEHKIIQGSRPAIESIGPRVVAQAAREFFRKTPRC